MPLTRAYARASPVVKLSYLGPNSLTSTHLLYTPQRDYTSQAAKVIEVVKTL